MITRVSGMFASRPSAGHDLASRYKYVMVDEFQDCNTSQCDLLLSLLTAAGHSNVVACGDDRQSIFGFRGGHHGPGVFQWLVDTYPGEAEITTLVTSHRCRYSPVFSVPLFFLAPLRAFFN